VQLTTQDDSEAYASFLDQVINEPDQVEYSALKSILGQLLSQAYAWSQGNLDRPQMRAVLSMIGLKADTELEEIAHHLVNTPSDLLFSNGKSRSRSKCRKHLSALKQIL